MRNLFNTLTTSFSSTIPPAPPNTNETPQQTMQVDFPIPPHILIIGAGSRGHAYASALTHSTNAVIAAVAEPLPFKRVEFGKKFIWGKNSPRPEQQFEDWRMWVKYEIARRERERAGESVERGVDALVVCVLDEMHVEVLEGVGPLELHVLSEKPLATTLEGCLRIWEALGKRKGVDGGKNEEEGGGEVVNGKRGAKETVFGICHVLRYSPHNMLLRELVLEREVIGDVLSIEHVEPVGWWHFSHSYVRGNWRKESVTAPSLLTKSCHDIDFIMWMLCSPPPNSKEPPHLPSFLTSTGSRKFFKKSRKPEAAGEATNCLSCPIEEDCNYSANKIYLARNLLFGNAGWPVKIVNPEIEDCYNTFGVEAASEKLLGSLREDYAKDTPVSEVESRPWFGRCVWESDNDVCDDQCVTITWDDDPLPSGDGGKSSLKGRGAKTAQFHMVAFTEKICERRGRIYGTKGEIEYDSSKIKVHDFRTGYTKTHHPHQTGGGHGGGDEGLARQFVMAVDAVNHQGMSAADAQRKYLGCDLEEAFRSHAMVFAAEDARKQRKVIDWKQWWSDQVERHLHQR
ncbi:streptomycin biosynthesis protein StrI [Lepidopterella palustris CBS 459.81]|uniref:Streptomycin biosynthesis protein StrI n=1 Tax=Lepidopterella palustris CBS 459.81 TaxID=1314670 RepID=A0A8E2JF05_9PEZI|nr:streptomycin biosynthesis protein StrI [Lepidopterella palustris CBS 459.81]